MGLEIMKQCSDCGTTEDRIIKAKKFNNTLLCNKCYQIWSQAGGRPTEYELPQVGEIKYNPQGYPICHICGRAYRKILTHVHQKHDIPEKEYKTKFGLDRTKGIIASETKAKLQTLVKNNYDLVVKKNLTEGGKKTRFIQGIKGRTRDQCSIQTMKRLKEYYWNGKFKKKEE